METLGYLNADLRSVHEAEEKRRTSLQSEILSHWKASAKTIKEQNESLLQKEARREAVLRIEDAARTETEFDRVTILWDCRRLLRAGGLIRLCHTELNWSQRVSFTEAKM